VSNENDLSQDDADTVAVGESAEMLVLPGWMNWVQHLSGAPYVETQEYSLHTDARVTGNVDDGLGPYMLLNALAFFEPLHSPNVPPTRIVLRVRQHEMTEASIDWQQTEVANFHGGAIDDEFGSLLSLALGFRCQSGGMVRRFEMGGDPLGRPTGYANDPPYLLRSAHRSLIPRLDHQTVALADAVDVLQQYPQVPPIEAQSLVKAARLYQQALWIADADPHQAWLQLVNALEVGAVTWVHSGTPLENLTRAKPAWVERLRLLPTDDFEWMTEQLAMLVGSTSRFIKFTINFLPPPPDCRPPTAPKDDPDRPNVEPFQVNWSKTAMREHLETIYDWRSRALHDGTPFPLPMCQPPWRGDNDWPAPAEKPLGLGSYGLGGQWTAADTPMTLATFEYLVRGVLLKWWESLV
jgi:hypothetical protein